MSDVPVLKDVLVYLSTLQIDKSVIERVFGIFPSPEVWAACAESTELLQQYDV